MSQSESLSQRATALGLHGLVAHLPDIAPQPWVKDLLE